VVAKYSDFGPIEVVYELSIGTKIVTLNDLEQRNDPYSALFHRIRHRKTIMRPNSVSKSTFGSL